MSKSYFVLGIHNHQPVGNFDSVFRMAYERSYRPFLETALEHPGIRFSLHTTGCLWEWLEQNEQGYFNLVGKLLARNQVELLGGGFYEPILPILPRADALEQIARMKSYLKDHFGSAPRGMWLAERVWEPGLAELLAEAGVEYLPLDDYHFYSAGHSKKELSGYFLTESNAAPVALFPIDQALRYAIPFKEPEETLAYFREQAELSPNRLFVMADDGEKFGLWPKTYDWVYEKKWLHRFFEMLEDHSDEIELITFSEARDKLKPAGRTYLPTCSYFEMGEWVLPSDAGTSFEHFLHELDKREDWEELKPFMRGGFWRGFLAKYPEVNYMHKKMLRASKKYHDLTDRKKEDQGTFYTSLLRGQCNCPYWHGVFGGLYLPHLRHATWKELILAEAEADDLSHRGRKWLEIDHRDHDADGNREILIENAFMNAYFSPQRGGTLFEWDYRPVGYNVLNTLTRHAETYHNKIELAVTKDEAPSDGTASIHDLVLSKEKNIGQYLHLDKYPRAALLEHFPGWNSELEEFYEGKLSDYGTFLNEPYGIDEMFTDGMRLKRIGKIGDTQIQLCKTIRAAAGKPSLQITYEVKNLSQYDLHSPIGVEWNLALKAGNSPMHYFSLPKTEELRRPLGEKKSHLKVKEIELADEHEGVKVNFSFDDSCTLWRVPVESVSLSEGGFERVFQSIAMLFIWELHLIPGQTWKRVITASLAASK